MVPLVPPGRFGRFPVPCDTGGMGAVSGGKGVPIPVIGVASPKPGSAAGALPRKGSNGVSVAVNVGSGVEVDVAVAVATVGVASAVAVAVGERVGVASVLGGGLKSRHPALASAVAITTTMSRREMVTRSSS